MAKDQKWLCENETCKALLGYVNEERNQVRIKYKDLYVTVEGGRITLVCRHCAKVNELIDQEFLSYIQQLHGKQAKPEVEPFEVLPKAEVRKTKT